MSEEMQTTESHSHSVTSEKEFIREMIPHHEEAVQTSKIILSRSQNESLKKIAQSIVSAQEQEILQLKDWLNLWYPGAVGVALYKPMMRDLSYLQGEELDTTYMTDMILHHQGAITMAKSVLTLSPRAEVANLANGIVRSQSEEIKTFETLLANTATKNKADSAMEEHSHSH
jgi:uncharacterized protein (DUF305 family)